MTGTEPPWRAAWAERPRLLGIARRRSWCRDDAEEIVSEAILRCVTHPRLQPERLPAMLTAVTMRLCVDRLRERVVAEQNGPRLLVLPRQPNEEVLDRAEAIWLSAEIARLADRESAAITARMLGLTVAETAEALGMTYKSVESALDRGRRKLRAAWTRTLGLTIWLRKQMIRTSNSAAITSAAVLVGFGLCSAYHHKTATSQLRPTRPATASASVVVTRTAATLRPLTARPSQARRTSGIVSPGRTSGRPTYATPELKVGPVRQEPVGVTVDDDPVGRVQECVESRKLTIEASAKRVAVVCDA